MNCVAKFVWSGQYLSQKKTFGKSSFDNCQENDNLNLKWTKEIANTSPDSLQLTSDLGAILIQDSGFYEVAFSFFVSEDLI